MILVPGHMEKVVSQASCAGHLLSPKLPRTDEVRDVWTMGRFPYTERILANLFSLMPSILVSASIPESVINL